MYSYEEITPEESAFELLDLPEEDELEEEEEEFEFVHLNEWGSVVDGDEDSVSEPEISENKGRPIIGPLINLKDVPTENRTPTDIINDIRNHILKFPSHASDAPNVCLIHPHRPPILPDPGEFHVPCIIRGPIPIMGLADTGASVNLMPFSIYNRLRLAPLESAKTVITLVDDSAHEPLGIAKSVGIDIGHVSFLVDFIVLDMPEDPTTPLILGRPFLATAMSSINFQNHTLTLRDQCYSKILHITPRNLRHSESACVIKDKCGEICGAPRTLLKWMGAMGTLQVG